jgi:hypothetical protein
LGTDGPTTWRSTASGVLNTAAQLGTAVGIAVLLLIASATTGVTGRGTAGPVIAWTVAGIVAAAGALTYLRPIPSLTPTDQYDSTPIRDNNVLA